MNYKRILQGFAGVAVLSVATATVAAPLQVSAPTGASRDCLDAINRLNASLRAHDALRTQYYTVCVTDKMKSTRACKSLLEQLETLRMMYCTDAVGADMDCGTAGQRTYQLAAGCG